MYIYVYRVSEKHKMDSNYSKLEVIDGNLHSRNPYSRLISPDHRNVDDLEAEDGVYFDDLPLLSVKGPCIYGAVFNLTTSIIGAGIMALPATMKVLGLVLGVILIFLMGSLHHVGVFDQWLSHGFWDHRKIVILVVLVLFLAPLCSLYKIDSLSLTSAASVALAVIFVTVVFVVALIKLVEGKIEPPRMSPDFGSKEAILDLLVIHPYHVNAYVCHFNVQPIYNELEDRSPQKMLKGATTAVSLGFTFPSLIALRLSKEGIGLSRVESLLSWLMLTLAIIVSVVGVVGNIFSLRSDS
ncbi:hypothetical protein CASFOL_001257 [Castilleja foliolosa]|uniref:Amino acid transporter transmembrane domain-containing protein n=1 Tax=Castilleja foliolosa TaxID=1961234 RepID=A0ABD3EMP9_9LAMI